MALRRILFPAWLLCWAVAASLSGCVRHDLDPQLAPYLLNAGNRTTFSRAIPDAYPVCIVTEHYQAPEACVTLGEIRRLILSRRAAE